MPSFLSTTKGKLVAGGAALALVLLAGWFLGVAPKRSQATELESEVRAKHGELAQRRAALANPSAAVEIRASDLFRLSKALPETPNGSSVILDVDRLARSKKLRFDSIAPSAPALGTDVLKQPYGLVVQGRFTSVAQFLAELRRLVTVRDGHLDVRGRVYSIDSVELGEPDNDAEFPNVKATVTVSAYSFSPTAPVAESPTDQPTTTDTSPGTVAAGATP